MSSYLSEPVYVSSIVLKPYRWCCIFGDPDKQRTLSHKKLFHCGSLRIKFLNKTILICLYQKQDQTFDIHKLIETKLFHWIISNRQQSGKIKENWHYLLNFSGYFLLALTLLISVSTMFAVFCCKASEWVGLDWTMIHCQARFYLSRQLLVFQHSKTFAPNINRYINLSFTLFELNKTRIRD